MIPFQQTLLKRKNKDEPLLTNLVKSDKPADVAAIVAEAKRNSQLKQNIPVSAKLAETEEPQHVAQIVADATVVLYDHSNTIAALE